MDNENIEKINNTTVVNEEKILKCKQKFKKSLISGIFVCAFGTWLFYSLICLIARTDGGTVTFNSNHIIILSGLYFGLYGTYVIEAYVIYLIKVKWYKRKK